MNEEEISILSKEKSITNSTCKFENSSISDVVFLLLKAMIGINLLIFPYLIFKVGILIGVPLIVIIHGLLYYTTSGVFDVVDMKGINPSTYSDISMEISGNFVRHYTNFSILLCYLTGVTSYVMYFLLTIDKVSCFYNIVSLCSHRYRILVVVIILLLPLIYIKDHSILGKFCLFGVFAIIFAIFLIFIEIPNHIQASGFNFSEIPLFNLYYLSPFICSVIVMTEYVGIMTEIRHQMKDKKEFKRSYSLSIILNLIIVITFSLVCVMSFKGNLKEIVILSFPLGSNISKIVDLLFLAALLISYPLQMIPIYEILSQYILNDKKGVQEIDDQDSMYGKYKKDLKEEEGECNLTLNRIIFRSLASVMVFILALVFKRLNTMLVYLSSIAGPSISFIIPVIIYEDYMKSIGEYQNRRSFVLNAIIFVLGIVLIPLCLYYIVTTTS